MNDALSGPKTILVVDDEAINRKVMAGLLDSFGHKALVAVSGRRGLEMLNQDVDLVLLDIMMPDMDGFSVARAIRARQGFEDLPIIMVTALTAKQDRLKAVEAGANDFVAKPIDATELRVRMESLLKMKQYRDELKVYQAGLEAMVQAKTEALVIAMENLKHAQQATVRAHLETLHKLSAAAEYKDEDTAQHIHRMSRYSGLMARHYGLSEAESDLVLRSSPMHDIGKIGIPDAILIKPGPLTAEEWVVMKTHTTIGASILESDSSDFLEAGRVIALAHHEKWDGTGYPQGLAGEDIPLYGRICAVADVFDALTSRRPYKPPYSNDKSLAILREGRGVHFDPKVLDVFLDHLDEVFEIQRRFRDGSPA
ncbi:MAG: HD domain-containing phosphohydrolase [Desulfovibrionaceae bacterium]